MALFSDVSKGGARSPSPLIFRPNWGPKGGKFLWGDRAPLYLRVWMTGPPSYLKVWIRHCFLFHWFLKRQILIRAERYLGYRWAPFLADCVLLKEWTELYASGLYASDKKTTPRSNIYTVLKTFLLFFSWCSVRGLFIYFAGSLGRFPFRKKTRKFRWEQKWNFRLVKSCSIWS